jgi:hypothetical protein
VKTADQTEEAIPTVRSEQLELSANTLQRVKKKRRLKNSAFTF